MVGEGGGQSSGVSDVAAAAPAAGSIQATIAAATRALPPQEVLDQFGVHTSYLPKAIGIVCRYHFTTGTCIVISRTGVFITTHLPAILQMGHEAPTANDAFVQIGDAVAIPGVAANASPLYQEYLKLYAQSPGVRGSDDATICRFMHLDPATDSSFDGAG